MRIIIDRDLCDSHGRCAARAPEIFELRDDDVLYVLDEQPPESSRAAVEEAAQLCPKCATTIAD
jgi:ferredoxin